jgi:hypothetical protein
MFAANAVFFVLLWDQPGVIPVLLTMALAGATLRAGDLGRTLPPEASRVEHLGVWTFLRRHPLDPDRPVPPLAPGLRVARGAALILTAGGLIVLGREVKPWELHPYLDDLWAAVELALLAVGNVELLSPLLTRLGIGELLLTVEGFHPGLAWSRSLRQFWSDRWNRPTSACLRRAVFDPAGGRRRLASAILATFVVSGLLHAPQLLLAGPERRPWAILAAGTLLFFVLHGLGCLLEGLVARGRRRWLGRLTFYGTFLVTLPLYPAPLFLALGVHGRPLETATPLVVLRALGLR